MRASTLWAMTDKHVFYLARLPAFMCFDRSIHLYRIVSQTLASRRKSSMESQGGTESTAQSLLPPSDANHADWNRNCGRHPSD